MSEMSERPLRLLSLDGGGVTAISELVVLQGLMRSIQKQNGLTRPSSPHEVFDLIGATGHGGLIALMLGRLRLTVEQALCEYRVLAKQVFGKRKMPGKIGNYKTKKMEIAIKDLVARYTQHEGDQGNPDLPLLDMESGECKVFVCARSALAMEHPRLLCSYSAFQDYPDATVWQAGRATTADPLLFKRLRIESLGIEDELIDASLGCKNPMKILLEQASSLYPPDRPVSCIVSIGSGKPPLLQLPQPGLFQRILPTKILSVLEALAYDTEATAQDMDCKFYGQPGLYFRLNVSQKLAGIGKADWKQLRFIEANTLEYLDSHDSRTAIQQAAASLSSDVGICHISDL